MIDFSKSINFLTPEVSIDYNDAALLQSVDYDILLNSLKNRYKIEKKGIELFNGFSSSIYSILKFLNLKYCFIYSPCSIEYKKAANNLGYEVRLINRFENLFLPIKDDSIVIFANPSYFDGTFYDLENLFEYWISKKATIIIDETLLDFCSEETAINYLKSYEKTYIIKDFKYYYSNEKLNITSIFSNKKNIQNLRKFEPEDKLSFFDMVYLVEALKDENFKLISNSINTKNRIELEKILHSNRYIDFLYHSSTNSILAKIKDISLQEIIHIFEKRGIKISSLYDCDLNENGFINIYINSKESIKSLKKALNEL